MIDVSAPSSHHLAAIIMSYVVGFASIGFASTDDVKLAVDVYLPSCKRAGDGEGERQKAMEEDEDGEKPWRICLNYDEGMISRIK